MGVDLLRRVDGADAVQRIDDAAWGGEGRGDDAGEGVVGDVVEVAGDGGVAASLEDGDGVTGLQGFDLQPLGAGRLAGRRVGRRLLLVSCGGRVEQVCVDRAGAGGGEQDEDCGEGEHGLLLGVGDDVK